MNRNRRVTLRAVATPVLAALLGAGALIASLTVKPAPLAADTAAAPTASADAVPASTANAAGTDASGKPKAGPPPLPRFDADPFSEEKSPRPKAEEWKPVLPVALTDPGPLPFECNAYRLREWVKIRCSKLATASVALLGGAREDVFVFADPPVKSDDASGPLFSRGGEILFAVRRGDARVFEWSTFGESYEGPGFPTLAFMVSESWAPGEAAPTLIVHAP
jgi:hypothetical protein